MLDKRIIALDVGDSRIGVSVSDLLGMTAQGVGVINRKNISQDIDKIKEYIKEYDCGLIIVGNPINMDGQIGTRAIITKEFCDILKENVQNEIKLWDERLSTREAERALELEKVHWKKKKEVIDMMAAQIILASYLDYTNLKGGF